jgi:hypothetical protein
MQKSIFTLTALVALVGSQAANADDNLNDWLHLCDKPRSEYWTKLCIDSAEQESAQKHEKRDESAKNPEQRLQPERKLVRRTTPPRATCTHRSARPGCSNQPALEMNDVTTYRR